MYNHFTDCDTVYNLLENNAINKTGFFYIIRNKKKNRYDLYIDKTSNLLYLDDYQGETNKNEHVPIYSNVSKIKKSNNYVAFFKKKNFKKDLNLYIKNDYNVFDKSLFNLFKYEKYWTLRTKENDYMGVIYNENSFVKKNNPDEISIILPTDYLKTSVLPKYRENNYMLHDYFNYKRNSIKTYYNVPARYNERLDSYVLKFAISGGIISKKNTIISQEYCDDETYLKENHIMETLKINNNVMIVSYKKPFSTIHAFTYGVTRFLN